MCTLEIALSDNGWKYSHNTVNNIHSSTYFYSVWYVVYYLITNILNVVREVVETTGQQFLFGSIKYHLN